MKDYLGPLEIYLAMIFKFGAEISYKSLQYLLILSENLASAMEDPSMIDNKLVEDLYLRRVVPILSPTGSFISSSLGLVSKYDGGFKQIHHLSHPKGRSVNDNISDGTRQLQYARFQKVRDLILRAGQLSIIMKRDVKDAFWNVLVTL